MLTGRVASTEKNFRVSTLRRLWVEEDWAREEIYPLTQPFVRFFIVFLHDTKNILTNGVYYNTILLSLPSYLLWWNSSLHDEIAVFQFISTLFHSSVGKGLGTGTQATRDNKKDPSWGRLWCPWRSWKVRYCFHITHTSIVNEFEYN